MSSSASLSDGERIRQMISSLSPDAIARLIPQEKIKELLRAQKSNEQPLESAVVANQPASAVSRKKKKVNGFMAFRSYYAGIFSDRPQKERSPLITTLWQTDPFRPRWAIMASVFSRVRDFAGTTKGRIVMSGFLRVACPRMGIPKPSDYLRCLNWQVVSSAAAGSKTRLDLTLHQTAVPPVADQVQVPMTELELLRACLQGGFPFENSSQLLRQMEDSSVTIMTQTAPPSGDVRASSREINQEYTNTLISDPTDTVASLLSPNGDISNFLVDIQIIPTFQAQDTTPIQQDDTAPPLQHNMLFDDMLFDDMLFDDMLFDDISVDYYGMLPASGQLPAGHRDTPFDYSHSTIGLW
ncbi:hypothetical protein GGTG_09273 [Gaeumannomyces tritici R3-111a-1]|uniref:Alpha box domain-containing protein n=1 Tax=Gaeumannomyces tritici (strain R3-111a-1) TaxID=644352 RepID=J3P6X7_GAET3|nr:hypothetical protein GGTG_09273 [Gaeumannomyces tritici R3-111a-1]EJT72407.1 hypothetical protein GGTG_09273 [Gaeumannomyces tritici R3-111a-1]